MTRSAFSILSWFLFMFCFSTGVSIPQTKNSGAAHPIYILSRGWLYSPKRDSEDEFSFRKFVNEENKFRNVLVLSCPKTKVGQMTLEIIPPTSLSEKLVLEGTDQFQETHVRFIDKIGTTQAPGDYDMIAAFVSPDFSALDRLDRFLENNEGEIHIVRPDVRFHFRAPGGEVGDFIRATLSSEEVILQMSDVKTKCRQ